MAGARHPALTLSAADADGTLFGYATSANMPGYGIGYANGRYTTFRDPHEAGTGPQAGTVIYGANSDGAVAGAYTCTNGTATQFPYAKGFIARPNSCCSRRAGTAASLTPRPGSQRGQPGQAPQQASGWPPATAQETIPQKNTRSCAPLGLESNGAEVLVVADSMPREAAGHATRTGRYARRR